MRKIIAISLALLMLFSNMGFAIAIHYCGGMAVESKLMYGHDPLDCGMATMDMAEMDNVDTATVDKQFCPSELTHELQLTKTPCCENEYQSLDVDGDYEPTVVQPSLNLAFVAAFAVSFLEIAFPTKTLTSRYADYSPPLIEQDISVLYQVFRI
ncbi:HYC_CC_PP family protein [Tunicatimonas pelagia]|uniref:HYC_CC_PP family protein n=1 Tax=Tunicatimonas pelagia TaxID=931531 RepID=UPI0026662026|nr:hypothetical protein [Tunicatimonas pelagia]WKN45395.1 hypothetical protein P0M28_10545 [Tunicatimonas pelagia]